MSEKMKLNEAKHGVCQASRACENLGDAWVKSGQSAQMAACSLRGLGEVMLKASKAASEQTSRLPLIRLRTS